MCRRDSMVRMLKLKLHEIELFAKNPEASKQFYRDVLGIPLALDEKGLKCFDSGWPGLDIDLSVHFPCKVSLSFLVEDLDQFVQELREKGMSLSEIKSKLENSKKIRGNNSNSDTVDLLAQRVAEVVKAEVYRFLEKEAE